MLKKKYRLARRIYKKHAEALETVLFTLRIARNEFLYSRFGFVISKRVDKRATVRNRVKRRASACIESMFSRIKPGYDMVFIMKREAVEKIAKELCQTIESVLEKRGLFC